MSLLLTLINFIACGVIWFVAMYFYLRHGMPRRLRHHVNQIGLVLMAAGALSLAIWEANGHRTAWWELVFRVGVAIHMALTFLRWRQHKPGPQA